jgi:hypothetical protein
LKITRNEKKLYEMNQHFENAWVAKLPWKESMVGANYRVYQVKWKVYNKIERCNKLLVPKLKCLWEHASFKRAINVILGLVNSMGVLFFEKKLTCVQWMLVCVKGYKFYGAISSCMYCGIEKKKFA